MTLWCSRKAFDPKSSNFAGNKLGSTSQRPIVGRIETISGNVSFFYRYLNLSGMKFFAELFTFSLILAGLSVLETYDALVAILKSLFLNLVNFFA